MKLNTAFRRTARSLAALVALGVAVTAEGQPLEAQLPDSVGPPDPHGATQRDPHVLPVQEGVDFRAYDAEGRTVPLEAILDAATEGDVLLIGEEHEDGVGHALELRLLVGALARLEATVAERPRSLVLSLEMFERDVQYVLDEYLAGLISEEHFVASARPWDNYVTGYRPMVEFAKAHGLQVVAANAPRRYVSRVTAEGPESLLALSPLARSFLPPLPYPGPSEQYRAEWHDIMGSDTTDVHERAVGRNAIQAQALWDAAMGHAVAEALVRDVGALVVHLAGSFHVARGTGVPERLADYRPGTRVTTVVLVPGEDVDAWTRAEHGDLADFVVLTAATRAPE